MKETLFAIPAAQMWTLSDDRRSVRLQLPPVELAGVDHPVQLGAEFDAITVDQILQRLSELRIRMLPPPVRG